MTRREFIKSCSVLLAVATMPYEAITLSDHKLDCQYTDPSHRHYAPCFSADGTKLYGADTGGKIYQYILSAPWDISTASCAQKLEL